MTLLNKKRFIAKSFRIDEKLSEDLGILSDILERSQNDLANVAIEKLLKDNLLWLGSNIFVDGLIDFISGSSEKSKINIQNIKISLSYNDDDICMKYENLEDKSNFVFNDMDSCIKKLRELSMYVNYDSIEMKKYLETRFSYM